MAYFVFKSDAAGRCGVSSMSGPKELFPAITGANRPRDAVSESFHSNQGGLALYLLSIFCFSDLSLSAQLWIFSFAGPSHIVGGTNERNITMANGTVKWFNSTKGFGFIAPEGSSKDVFVHVSALERAGIHGLNDGQAVSFDVERDRNGRESAMNLVLA